MVTLRCEQQVFIIKIWDHKAIMSLGSTEKSPLPDPLSALGYQPSFYFPSLLSDPANVTLRAKLNKPIGCNSQTL